MKNENVLDFKPKNENSYLSNPVMTSACIINRSNETFFQLIRSVLVRNSYPLAPIIPAVQPPVLDPYPKSVEDCGWTTMDYLGVAASSPASVAAPRVEGVQIFDQVGQNF